MTVVARASIKSAVWQKVVLGVAILAVVAMGAVHILHLFNFGETEARFIIDLGLAFIALTGCIFVIATGAFLFFEDIEHGAALMIFARPLARWEWVLGKLIALTILSALFCLGLTGMLITSLWVRGLLTAENISFVAGAGFLQWLKFSIMSALVLWVSACSRGLLSAVIMSLVAVFVCHWQGMAASIYARSDSSMVRMVVKFFSSLVPDFTLYDPAVGMTTFLPALQHAVLFTAFLAFLACYAFRAREL